MSEKKRKPPEKLLAFRLDDETHRRIAQLARDQGVKPTTMAREMIKRTAAGFDAQPMAARFSAIDEELMELDSAVLACVGMLEQQQEAFNTRLDRIEALLRYALIIASRTGSVTWNTAASNDRAMYERSMKEADVTLQKKLAELLPTSKPNGADAT